MTDQTYNGWTNYETWAVGMFLDGNYTGEGIEEALKNYVECLLRVGFDEVNWRELAEHKLAEVRDNAST